MFVTLHRNGLRAIFVRTGTPLDQIPPEALRWLGRIERSDDAELNDNTPMLGLSPSAIIFEISVNGYCVLMPPPPSKDSLRRTEFSQRVCDRVTPVRRSLTSQE